ncbi:MAG: MFS transporter [Legionellales bacterium]|nr:MFS transporter [Legionellales bacterium]|tara:strand:- start:449 stop:1735 length:1287 start_codon:yes stop_codon:yes gene_type:complete
MNEDKNKLSLLGFIIWFLAALFFLYEFFLRTFVGSLAPQIIPDLHLNAETFALLGSAYYIAYGAMQVPVGILADKFGVKKIMIFATLLCAVATYLFANSTSFGLAFITRMMMGLGSSFAFVCLLVIAVTWFPRKYFGMFAGASQFIGTMGPLLAGGPLVLFLQETHSSWRYTLSLVAGFGIILCLLIIFIVRSKPRDGERHLIYLEKKTDLKKSLLSLVSNRQAWSIALYSAANYVPIALLGAVWGTSFLEAQGLTQSQAADVISLSWLGYAIGCPLVGATSDFTHRRKPLLILCAILGLVITSVVTYMPNLSLYIYAGLFFMLGLAASGQNIGFATISESVDLGAKATALGMNNGAITLASAIIPPLVSYFINLSAGGHISHLQPENFYMAFALLPILYLIALGLSTFVIKETYCKPQKAVIHVNLN